MALKSKHRTSYINNKTTFSEAIQRLVFEYDMTHEEAVNYLLINETIDPAGNLGPSPHTEHKTLHVSEPANP